MSDVASPTKDLAAPVPSDESWVLPLDGSFQPDRGLIGGKAWSVARMMSRGLTVPPAFVVTTHACNAYLETGAFPPGLETSIRDALSQLEDQTGRTFGHGDKPLLVSVRSGSAISMPGMMDTVLNLGISSSTRDAVARESGDPAFAIDVNRRFLELFSTIVLKTEPLTLSLDATVDDWERQIDIAAGRSMPQDPFERLLETVRAVFESWNSRRAKRYRSHHGIADDLGTAVTVQAMVFGNLGADSGTGVLFSRNPLDGAAVPFGEFLQSAQGEDVVSGKFTPEGLDAMQRLLPEAHDGLMRAAAILERDNGDMQDIEFTVQSGKLYLLQSRTGKRAPAAAVKIAVDMCREGLIDQSVALSRVTAEQVRQLLSPRLRDPAADGAVLLASGEAACPGVGRGVVVTDSDEAERLAGQGQAVILVRPTTSPDDVHGMLCARAVVTETGGATSHAAVVSRALGLPSVVGCGVDALAGLKGRVVTVDGGSGRIFEGELDVVRPDETADPDLRQLAEWARSASPVEVRSATEGGNDPDVIDLGQIEGGEDPTQFARILQDRRGAMGGAIASDAGVRAALDAGLEFIVTEPALPVLLAAIHARQGQPDRPDRRIG